MTNYRRSTRFLTTVDTITTSLIITSLFVSVVTIAAPRSLATSAQERLAAGTAAFDRGDFAEAVANWEPLTDFGISGNRHDQVDLAIRLSTAYQHLGLFNLAVDTLCGALANARDADDPFLMLRCRARLAAVLTYSVNAECNTPCPEIEQDLKSLLRGIITATESWSEDNENATEVRRITASSLINLADLMVVRSGANGVSSKTPVSASSAINLYDRARAIALELDEREIAARAGIHAALTESAGTRHAEAVRRMHEEIRLVDVLPNSHKKVFLLIAAGKVYHSHGSSTATTAAASRVTAATLFHRAAAIANGMGDKRTGAYANGNLAELYSDSGRLDDALIYNRRALFAARETADDWGVYRWLWQRGRILNKLGRKSEAEDSLRRAITTLDTFRQDVFTSYRNDPFNLSFEASVGAVYHAYIESLLDPEFLRDPQSIAARLQEAVDTIERRQSAEIDEYFRDPCADQGPPADPQPQETFSGAASTPAQTAILYIVPLSDRIELIVKVDDGLHRFSPADGAANRSTLNAESAALRNALGSQRGFSYRAPARTLYQWLVEPCEDFLQSRSVDTLIWIADGPVRSLPISVLMDNDTFLIQRYALAVTPGVNRLNQSRKGAGHRELFAGGVTNSDLFRDLDLQPLEWVMTELETLEDLFSGHNLNPKVLVDSAFSLENFRSAIDHGSFSFVHIASHGQFSDNPRDTFIAAADQLVTISELERIIKPGRYRGRPIELLALSACETAAGNDRSALGLAGSAYKSGATCVLATLWKINDRQSQDFVVRFYRGLVENPALTKAQALQQAQQAVLKEWHPFNWSPYMIIGNWR